MLCTVIKSFKNSRGKAFPPGCTIEIPDSMLLKMTDYIQPIGQADNAPSDWRPSFRAWLEGDSLRTTGVSDNLATEIVKLAADNLPLQKKLLRSHVGAFSNPCWISTARKFVERAAALFDEGIELHQANYQAAEEMNLLAFTDELGIKFYPQDDTPPF